jgi:hypothetical protein
MDNINQRSCNNPFIVYHKIIHRWLEHHFVDVNDVMILNISANIA